jgi:Reverse transcriptase (RNA-dependent DNA polymerase)
LQDHCYLHFAHVSTVCCILLYAVYSIDSYRPISLLPILSKVFERHILSFLHPFIRVPHNQFGFVKRRSTNSALISATQTIHNGLDNKKLGKVIGIFLDVRKAFDRIPHTLLLRIFKIITTSRRKFSVFLGRTCQADLSLFSRTLQLRILFLFPVVFHRVLFLVQFYSRVLLRLSWRILRNGFHRFA